MVPFQDDKFLFIQKRLIDEQWIPFVPTNEDLMQKQRFFLWKEKKQAGWYLSMYMVLHKMDTYQTYESSAVLLQDDSGEYYDRMLHEFKRILIKESNQPENLF